MINSREGDGKRDTTVTEVSLIPCVCSYLRLVKHSNKGLHLLLPICLVSHAIMAAYTHGFRGFCIYSSTWSMNFQLKGNNYYVDNLICTPATFFLEKSKKFRWLTCTHTLSHIHMYLHTHTCVCIYICVCVCACVLLSQRSHRIPKNVPWRTQFLPVAFDVPVPVPCTETNGILCNCDVESFVTSLFPLIFVWLGRRWVGKSDTTTLVLDCISIALPIMNHMIIMQPKVYQVVNDMHI